MEQSRFESYEELLSHLRARLLKGAFILVAVDGASGAGKSYLAGGLQAELHIRTLELDEHLHDEGDSYPDRVLLSELSAAVEDARREELPIAVVGVCALAALDRAGESPDIHLYIQRLSSTTRMAADIDLFDENCTWFRDLSDDFVEEGSKPRVATQDWIDRQVGTYHKLFRPLQRADIIYCRVEGCSS